jgi:glycosyltransferase involved in cell wall biosynthesis
VAERTNVLVVNDSMNLGGAERVAVDIANSLDRDRFEVTFCSTRTGGPLVDVLAPDVDHVALGRTATWDLRKVLTLRRLVRERGIDLIHSHGRGTMKFVALSRVLGAIDVPHVFHDHFGWLHVNRSAPRGLREAIQRGVDDYLGVDQRLCDWAVEAAGMPAERVHLVRSGVDVSRFTGVDALDLREEFGLPDDTVVFVMVANFRPQKDHPTLFRALATLSDAERSRCSVVVVGSTTADPEYFAGCSAMAADLGVDGLLAIVGPRDDLPEVLRGADAGLVTSKNETGPLVVLEYMASSLPFVATDTGEITRQVRDTGAGWTPAPRDAHEVGDAIRALLDLSPAERRAMGRRGRAAVESTYDQRIVTATIEGIYDRMLERDRTPDGVGKST